MNFKELYDNNRSSVERALTAMWCGESNNDSQDSYILQLKNIIKDLFAPKNAIPVVQCMNSYKSVFSVRPEEAEKLVGGLWKKVLPKDKYWDPYEHQYQCWNTLLNERTADDLPKSICVTTGTGSGKTECFMLPLVYDLIQQNKTNEIQALFLYPLNALMEDQKERLEKLLEGTDLRYAVYNGGLPEKMVGENDPNYKEIRAKIDIIKGIERDENGNIKRDKNGNEIIKFPHAVGTREELRRNPANILLTNPTMLEYILLRGSDSSLIDPNKHSLRWVAIDETHTYTGAGAAELAMLLRRVLLAFNVKATNIRFATSSATFSNGDDADEKLIEFIAGITGLNKDQINIKDGEREGKIPSGQDEERWRLIRRNDYIGLNELFPQGSISEKLQLLDEMCQREEDRYRNAEQSVPDMKLKVHYFYRVPNNGLFVRLSEHQDGSFKIYTGNNIEENDNNQHPLLELCRCKHCGEYVTLARVNTTDGTYEPLELDESDMFDLVDDSDDTSNVKYVILGLSKNKTSRGDNNAIFKLKPDGKMESILPKEVKDGEWHLVGNTHCRCPYCNSKQTKSKSGEDASNDAMDDSRLQKFRLSADFISRMLAPSILDHLEKGDPNKLHDGQQYISFVDSRQAAAQATLKQNLEQERMWFYSTIYHELCKRNIENEKVQKKIDTLTQEMKGLDDSTPEYEEKFERRKELRKRLKNYMEWGEIADYLINEDKYCSTFCSLFVKRSGDEELDDNGNIKKDILEKYVHSIMAMYLGHRPSSAAAPETLGLFHPYYPQLCKIRIPAAVSRFNSIIQNEENKISDTDWQNLIQIFIDHTVRNNQSVFLKIADNNPIDIFSCVRFAAEKPHRRPVTKPVLEKGKSSSSRIVMYLCKLLVRDDNSLSLNAAQDKFFDVIKDVVDAFWTDITKEDNKILQNSMRWRWDDEKKLKGKFVTEREEALRFNLTNMSFSLYKNVFLCDTTNDNSDRHTKQLRPIENNFKHISPYLAGTKPIDLDDSLYQEWDVYPYYLGSGKSISKELLISWAKEKRSLLWNNKIWGEDGIYSDRLEDIHIFPNLFIQEEHTAQVDKDVARGLQASFKDHAINILACSTTMEMGVDLGNLEVVLLYSVPPMPANYKQRAGRSGRNNKVRSACITLCGSDAIGLRTLYHPIEKIINRTVEVPTVDLKSPQVIRRHVNSFLIRAFGVFAQGDNGGSLSQKVVDYYTPFKIENENGFLKVKDRTLTHEINPSHALGNKDETFFETFNRECQNPDQIVSLKADLDILLKDTCYESKKRKELLDMSCKDNNDRYSELALRIGDIKYAYDNLDANSESGKKFRNKLQIQYLEILNTRLLEYWATHRFTPNANMPVNIKTFDLNSNKNTGQYNSSTISNPSYSLREALSQYSPGRCVTVDGVVYTVGGIEFTNFYKGVSSFKKIYRNSNKTVLDDGSAITDKLLWPVNKKVELEMVEPVSFLPDIEDSMNRIIDNKAFTHVNAQLIGTDDWSDAVTDPHLFSLRSNLETGNANILYYNEGKGYGYCFCPRCGRIVLEDDVADINEPLQFPIDFNTRTPRIKQGEQPKPKYHIAISGKDAGKPCPCSNKPDIIKRNIIIGGLLQTDFTEIRIRHKNKSSWMSERNREENLLYTLGIVFTQALADILGKERTAIDFTITPNSHICIFDTNPGGAGYSNQLKQMHIMKEVISTSKRMLKEARDNKTKDQLLNKFTLRYINHIDIQAAIDWIEEEEEVCSPTNLSLIYPNAEEFTLVNMIREYNKSLEEMILFVDNDFKMWDYQDTELCWRDQLLNQFVLMGSHTRFCIVDADSNKLERPILEIGKSIKGWAKDFATIKNPLSKKELYPLAYVSGFLYFTNDKECATLNNKWGYGTILRVKMDDPSKNAQHIDCEIHPETTQIYFLNDETDKKRHYKSNEIGELIHKNDDTAEIIIDKFIEHCKNSDGDLYVSYQDEHMKSIASFVLTIQTIEYFVKLIGQDFNLEFLLEEYSYDRQKPGIFSNIIDSIQRDQLLDGLTSSWLDDLYNHSNISGSLYDIESQPVRQLTHWRVLIFECDGKRLSIYPDGGLLNGWGLGKLERGEYYDVDTTTCEDHIPLERKEDIKYEVHIEDI